MASSGSVVKWFSRDISGTDYSELTRMAEKSPPGSRGLITLPYFLGEKTPIFDIKARGTILGLTLSHNKGDIFRSLLESVAFGFRHHLEVIEEIGIVPGRVFMTNGGSRNELWRSITADVVGHDAVYLEKHTGSSLGAAFLAGIATGVYHSWDEIGSFMQDKVVVKSDPANHELYSRYYQIYRDLYTNNIGLFSELFEIERLIREGG
jgi:xylulokinase